MSKPAEKDIVAIEMTLVHAMQLSLWLEMIPIKGKTKQIFNNFKAMAYKTLRTLKIEFDELYEPSAEISDSIMSLIQMDEKDREEIIELIKSKEKEHETIK